MPSVLSKASSVRKDMIKSVATSVRKDMIKQHLQKELVKRNLGANAEDFNVDWVDQNEKFDENEEQEEVAVKDEKETGMDSSMSMNSFMNSVDNKNNSVNTNHFSAEEMCAWLGISHCDNSSSNSSSTDLASNVSHVVNWVLGNANADTAANVGGVNSGDVQYNQKFTQFNKPPPLSCASFDSGFGGMQQSASANSATTTACTNGSMPATPAFAASGSHTNSFAGGDLSMPGTPAAINCFGMQQNVSQGGNMMGMNGFQSEFQGGNMMGTNNLNMNSMNLNNFNTNSTSYNVNKSMHVRVTSGGTQYTTPNPHAVRKDLISEMPCLLGQPRPRPRGNFFVSDQHRVAPELLKHKAGPDPHRVRTESKGAANPANMKQLRMPKPPPPMVANPANTIVTMPAPPAPAPPMTENLMNPLLEWVWEESQRTYKCKSVKDGVKEVKKEEEGEVKVKVEPIDTVEHLALLGQL